MSIFKSILNPEEVQEILDAILAMPPEKGNKEGGEYYKDSVGYPNLPAANKFIKKLEAVIKTVVGTNIAFENTYSRIYKKGSILGFHIDRPGLDITLSVCLKRDAPWELIASKRRVSELQIKNNTWKDDMELYKQDVIAIDSMPGDAGLIQGRKHPHWREPLVCNDDQTNVYIFYHWRRT